MKYSFLTLLLVAMTIGVGVYTFMILSRADFSLFKVFFQQVREMGWGGQFNLDFMCYLLLSGLWIMWRDGFSGKSVLIGIAASVLGIVFFAPYLIWLLMQHKGDLRAVVLGIKA